MKKRWNKRNVAEFINRLMFSLLRRFFHHNRKQSDWVSQTAVSSNLTVTRLLSGFFESVRYVRILKNFITNKWLVLVQHKLIIMSLDSLYHATNKRLSEAQDILSTIASNMLTMKLYLKNTAKYLPVSIIFSGKLKIRNIIIKKCSRATFYVKSRRLTLTSRSI